MFLYLEAWLDINREAVENVNVVAGPVSREPNFYFTQSADQRRTYLIALGWPGAQVRTKTLQGSPGMKVRMLGWPDALPWEQLGDTLVITTPKELADEANHPCKQAFVFRLEMPNR